MIAYAVAGMAFGDEGKGVVTDYLSRRFAADIVIRFNGGSQARHNVITPSGIHHTFAQFGAGTLAGAATFLSRFMLVEPCALLHEAATLARKGIAAPLSRMTIDPECVIVTPFHRYANRLRETARGSMRHGSVGQGIGEARSDEIDGLALRIKDLSENPRAILSRIQEKKLAELEAISGADANLYEAIRKENTESLISVYSLMLQAVTISPARRALSSARQAIFEGAQGVLLDEIHGYAPYNSWTDCTFGNAVTIADEMGWSLNKVGVFRSYFTRHGAGPFATEDSSLRAPEPHNGAHPWMGEFRCGHFDMMAAQYSARIARPDALAVTHMDRRPSNKVAIEYNGGLPRYKDEPHLIRAMNQSLGVEIEYQFFGPTASYGRALRDERRRRLDYAGQAIHSNA